MSIEETLVPVAPPLRMDEGGTLRVGKTRVRLDTVITAYKMGESPEQIAADFDTLSLADIHAVISLYLKNREAVEEYLREREEYGARVRERVEALCPPEGFRERLLARKSRLK